ncbi:MAG: PAS domain-containing protein [Chitinophagales bacterium]|nr:PAS domain-containing protein [Chitinophagales bacterium]
MPTISPSGKLALVYLSVSVLWILVGDSIALRISGQNAEMLDRIQASKGIFFVLASAALIYFLGERFNRNLESSFQLNEKLERKFKALNEAAREGILDYDFQTDSALVNEKMQFFVPCTDQPIPNFWVTYRSRIHPEDVGRISEGYRTLLVSNRISWQTELRLRGEDDKYYTVIFSSFLIRQSSGKPVRLIGAVQDVSELRNLQIEHYKQQLKYKRAMTRTIIKAQENERNRWAGELHDNVCQLLSVAKMYLMDMARFPEHRENLLPETTQLITDSITEIRQLSASIQSPVFSKMSLATAVQNLVANINRVSSFEFEWKEKGLKEGVLENEHKLMIYRIIQEQLNNITKYASATKVAVQLRFEGNLVTLEITDNGKGFDPADAKSGVGLRNMQSRLLAYQGTMDIHSAPGKGCRIRAQFATNLEKPQDLAMAL